jgi:tetratricopeptide (TPR) repeat protein
MCHGLCHLLQANTTLQHLSMTHPTSARLDSAENLISSAGLTRLFTVLATQQHLRSLEVTWSTPTVDEACTRAVAAMLTTNSTLSKLPIDRLITASHPPVRHLLLSAVKLNIGLTSSSSRLLLPRSVRLRLRCFAGQAMPASVSEEAEEIVVVSDLLMDSARLSPFDTWHAIGQGAFGQVYAAVLDGRQDVCIKTIQQKAGDAAQDRGTSFFRELALVHELDPDSPVRGVCVHPMHFLFPPNTTDTIWLVFPIMRNGSLDDALAKNRLNMSHCIQVLTDVAKALVAFHEADVLHRDIAARNVLLDEDNRAQLCDLGLACRGAHAWHVELRPIWNWSPELAMTALPHTPAGETWAFGVLMLETLTGQNPLLRLSLQDLRQAYTAWQRNGKFQSVPTIDPVSQSPQQAASDPVTDEADEHQLDALAVHPDASLGYYHSAAESSAAARYYHSNSSSPQASACVPSQIEDPLCDRSVKEASSTSAATEYSVAPDDHDGYTTVDLLVPTEAVAPSFDAVAWWQEHMCLTGSAPQTRALNLLVQACCRWDPVQRPRLVFVSQLLSRLVAPHSDVAETINVQSVTEVLLLSQWLMLGISVATRWALVDETKLVADKNYKEALQSAFAFFSGRLRDLETALGPLHLDVGTCLTCVVLLLQARGDDDMARPLFERAIAIREATLGDHHLELASDLTELAFFLKRRADYTSARPLYERALALRESAQGPLHVDVADGLNNLGVLYSSQGSYAMSIPLFERALAIQEASLGVHHTRVATTLNKLAYVYMWQRNFSAAQPLLERARSIHEASFGPHHPEVAKSLHDLATLLRDQGDHASARPLFERALCIREITFGRDHPTVGDTLCGLALLCYWQGDFAFARRLLERARMVYESVYGRHHPHVATVLDHFGEVLSAQSDFDTAQPMYERALAIRESVLGPHHPSTATSLNHMAVFLKKRGEYARARPLFERALAIRVSKLGPKHSTVATVLISLAELLELDRDYAAARPLYERALAISEESLGARHPVVAQCLSQLACSLHSQGDLVSARALHERALAIRESAMGPNHPHIATSLAQLGQLSWDQCDYPSARACFERAVAIRRNASGEQHPDTCSVMARLRELMLLTAAPAPAIVQ